MRVMWNIILALLETLLDGCKVCAKCTIASEIVLDTPDGTPRRREWKLDSICLEILLILMQDGCMVCIERTIGSKIVLDTPDGTPR
jgi:hypothetical protein